MTPYPNRLIEVDIPIARIYVHARRKNSIFHGHVLIRHIWGIHPSLSRRVCRGHPHA